MQHFHIMTRRSFLERSAKLGLGVALSTLVDIPLVVKRALAEGNIGLNGKKLLFIFLRGANDSLNSVIPIKDSGYVDSTPGSGTFGVSTTRANIVIPPDSLTDYAASGLCDFPESSPNSADPDFATFSYGNAIRLGNGFTALHPSLKFLAPIYNAGDLALIHRVGYPKQSRSHFDSQNYWENGNPNNNIVKDGIFYRAMLESGLANTNPLTGVSVQSSLPLILRGSAAAMTNLTDPTRYNLLGIPNTTAGNLKSDNALRLANGYLFPAKKNRELLALQYQNMSDTLSIFEGIDFSETGNTFRDNDKTDGDVNWYPGASNDSEGYYLFPTSNSKNGGYQRPAGGGTNTAKYVVDTGAYSFFTNLKAAALVLNRTDAIIAGSEVGGFDTHNSQGGVTGAHANLQRRIGWAMYALRKYFLNYSNKCTWNNLVVVTLSEFGRTSKQNTSLGTDHAEAGAMFVAGGAIKGYNKGNTSGIFNCAGSVDPVVNPLVWNTGTAGSMFAISSNYLRRTTDYRSMLGKLIRDHLGATQAQLDRIIPGYANPNEKLLSGGATPSSGSTDGTTITGELNII
jgi:uncharacterized protein (DUF1501 family)